MGVWEWGSAEVGKIELPYPYTPILLLRFYSKDMKPWVTFLLELLVLAGMSSCSTSEKQSYVAPKETPTPPRERDILPKSSVNWIGHWLSQDKRETLVREVAREFEFLNPEIEVNLKFPQEIFGNRR